MLVAEDEVLVNGQRVESVVSEYHSNNTVKMDTVNYYTSALRQYLESDRKNHVLPYLRNLKNLGEILRALKIDIKSENGFLDVFIDEERKGAELLFLLLNMLHEEMEKIKKTSVDICASDIHHFMKCRLADEYHILLCLKQIFLKHDNYIRKVFTSEPQFCINSIAKCLISRFSKCRLVALMLLTKLCDCLPHGHHLVMKTMTCLRLQLTDEFRFKFLINLLNSNQGSSVGFQVAGLKFLNAILDNSSKASYRVQLQSEMVEAGFRIQSVEEKLHLKDLESCREILLEVDKWNRNFIDVDSILAKFEKISIDSNQMKDQIEVFMKNIAKLEEDKINLMQIEKELNQKCGEKENELMELKKILENNALDNLAVVLKTEDDNKNKMASENLDYKWKSLSLPNFEVADDLVSPEREEVTVTPTVMLKKSQEIVKPEYYIYNGKDESSTDSQSSKATTSSGQKNKLVQTIKVGTDDDFDSALSESDSDSKIPPWRSPTAVFRSSMHKKAPFCSNSRLCETPDKKEYRTRISSTETIIVPLMKKHPAAVAESPSSVFRKLSSNRSGYDTLRSTNISNKVRIGPKNRLISSSLIKLSPLPVHIPAPDYPTEPDETLHMSTLKKTTLKFKKAFSERKKKVKPQVWDVVVT